MVPNKRIDFEKIIPTVFLKLFLARWTSTVLRFIHDFNPSLGKI